MTVSAPPLGAGVVGLGVGRKHADAVAACPAARLLWLVDQDRAKAAEAAGALGAPRSGAAFEEMLADPEVKAVFIASFDHDHFAQARAALRAGKHAFVEKPLCRSLEEMRDLKAAWEQGGRPHLRSNLVLRAAPLYLWLKDRIDAGELGEVYAIDGDYLFGRLEKITEGWRKDVPDYSVMQGGGIHLLDLVLWLAGQRPTRVHSAGNRICTRGTAFRYPDFVSSTFEFPSGLVARVTANFGCVHPHQHSLRVFGTKATFLLDDAGARLQRGRAAGSAAELVSLAKEPDGKGALIPDFLAAAASGADSREAFRREADLIAACAAADASLRTSQPAAVEQP